VDIPAEAHAVAGLARDLFGDALVGVYLHGSAATSGLRPRSDVDLILVLDRPLDDASRRKLLAELLRLSGRYPPDPAGPRCIELMVFLASTLAAPTFPARTEFLYGEWLRDGFEAGEIPTPLADPEITLPLADPEITLLLAQARKASVTLAGPPLASLLPSISAEQIRQAMRIAIPALIDNLVGDERNVLLTLARMWRTAAHGDFLSKDAAAQWVIPQVPPAIAATLTLASAAYVGAATDDWRDRQVEVAAAADYLRRQVEALLPGE